VVVFCSPELRFFCRLTESLRGISLPLSCRKLNLRSRPALQISFSAKDVEFSEWKGDVLAVAVTEKELSKDSDSKFENAVLKKLDGQLGGLLAEAVAEEDFTGKAGQLVVLRLPGQGFKRVGLVGLGQNAPSTVAASRGLGESVAFVAKAAQASSAAIVLASPSGIQEDFKLNAAGSIASGN
jgi:leucyl aminopeptidase